MKSSLETRIGIFFALALIAGVAVVELSSGLNFFQAGYRVHARFRDVHELKVGDPVKMGGYPVGRVESMKLGDKGTEVTMRLKEQYRVKTDSVATIQFRGLMGQNFVSLAFGSSDAPQATQGTVLKTKTQPDLGTLMAKVDNIAGGIESMTQSFSGEGFSKLLGPLTDFIKQNRPRIESMIKNMDTISTEIAQGRGTVGKLIQEDQLYREALTTVNDLNATAKEIRALADQAHGVVRGVQKGKGTLGRLTTDESLFEESKRAVVNLREILEKINRGDGSIGKLVNEEEFYNNLRLTLQKVERATDTLEDTGPMSVVGTAAGSLF